MNRTYQSEFDFRNKLGRALWSFVYIILFRLSPRPCHYWRILILRLFGADIDRSAKIYSSARIWAPWNLTMNKGSILGDRVDCYCVGKISIGESSVVSQDSCLCSATHDFRSDGFDLIVNDIWICDHVWVAARAFIGPGVELKSGTVVGACGVVTRSIDANSIVVGNPATVVGKR